MDQNVSMMAKSRSGEIDALRALAMLAVVAFHAHLLPFGWVGVWLFYVISGYVVTQSVVSRSKETLGSAGFSAFMHRRAVRIFPVYFAYLLIGICFSIIESTAHDVLSVASFVLFFNNIAMILGTGRIGGWPTGHLWTLSVEMQFYVVYGMALYFLPRRHIVPLLLALLILCPLARYGAAGILTVRNWPSLDAAYAIYAGPGLHFDIFAMGSLLAFTQQSGALLRNARPLAYAGFAALALYFTTYVGVNHLVRNEHGSDLLRNILSGILIGEHREVLMYSALGLAMTGLVALAATGDSIVRPLLRGRLLSQIGEISYGGYVFHQLALKSATTLLAMLGISTRDGGVLAHLAQFAIGVMITLPLAYFSFRWFETACQRLLSFGSRHTRPREPSQNLPASGLESL